jgi:prepilin signal peptidase PulO-like enzyme (type II secretory pathway)
MDGIIVLLAAVLGLLAGGLANMLADDLPNDGPIQVRRPHYPDGAPRAFLGLVAFVRGRRSSPGGARLGWRHPVVEVVTALAFALLAAFYPPDGQLLFFLVYAWLFVLITVIDLEHRLILFVTAIPLGLAGALDALLIPDPRPSLVDSLAGGVLGLVVFYGFWYGGVLFNRARAEDEADEADMEIAFGFGDVILATACGLVLGWQSMIFAMFITVFAGALGGIAWMVSRLFTDDGYAVFTALPYGPYIIFGVAVMLFLKEPMQQLLWSLPF